MSTQLLKLDFIKQNRLLKTMIIVLTFSTILIVNRGALVAARQHKDNASFAITHEVVYVPDMMQLRLLTLGYEQAAADFVWLRTLSYFARHFTTDREYPWLEHLLGQIIELDPKFSRVYHWAGANVLYGRTFTDEYVFRSNHFYELALTHDPDDVEAAYRLGMNYYFELKGSTSAKQLVNEFLTRAQPSVPDIKTSSPAEMLGGMLQDIESLVLPPMSDIELGDGVMSKEKNRKALTPGEQREVFWSLFNPAAEERRRYKRIGISYFEMAANNPKSKYKLRALVAGLAGKMGDYQLQMSSLVDKLRQTEDPEERKNLQERIEALEKNVDRVEVVKAANIFEERRKRMFPYDKDGHLFIQLGEPESDTVSDVNWRKLHLDINLDIKTPSIEEGQSRE